MSQAREAYEVLQHCGKLRLGAKWNRGVLMKGGTLCEAGVADAEGLLVKADQAASLGASSRQATKPLLCLQLCFVLRRIVAALCVPLNHILDVERRGCCRVVSKQCVPVSAPREGSCQRRRTKHLLGRTPLTGPTRQCCESWYSQPFGQQREL